MKKKIAIIILTIAVFATSIVSSVFAAVKDDKPVSNTQTVNPVGSVVEEGTTTDGWEYKVYSDGTASISGYKGTETTATFPKTINGNKITYIKPCVLKDSIIEKLIIPDATPFAKEVYTNHCLDDCFRLSTNLKEVVIGSMFARELPFCMFHSCKKLERVTFTEKFTEVASTIYTPGDEFNIEKTGCYINEFAFGYCPELHNIVIPEGVTRIGEAFSGSENINTIVAPTSLVTVRNSDGAWDSETKCPAPYGVKRLIILGTKTYTQRYTGIEIIGPKDSYIEEQMIANEFELIDIATIDVQKIIDEINGVEPVTETTTTSTTTSTTTNTTTSTSTSTATSTTTSTPVSTKPTVKKVAKVTVNKKSVVLVKGRTTTVKATVSPSNATNKKLKWMTSNKKVAVVNQSGKITAKGRGVATIKVMALDGSNKYATIKVTVKQPVTSVKLNKKTATLKVKGNTKQKTVTLKATVYPKNANNKAVSWKSSNSKIATVNSKGKVTAKKKGTCYIIVTAKDGSKKSAKCKIVVK